MTSYSSIVQSIRKKKTGRVYLLCGDEPYYIDSLTALFERELVAEEDKDFDQTTLYGSKEIKARDIISESMRLPMIGQKLLIVIREAQLVSDLEKLEPYLKELPETTTLVLAQKKKADKRKSLFKTIEQVGVVFESLHVPDYRLTDAIASMALEHNCLIDPRSTEMLADFLGNDLAKIKQEIDKLILILQAEGKRMQITADLIERHIGISREFNSFELLRAIIKRDTAKAYRIAVTFGQNEKANPIQPTLAVLFNYFSLLMAAHYLPDKSENGLMEGLGFKQRFQARDYMVGLRLYSPMQVYEIIHQIRLTDAASKGVEAQAGISNKELLVELLSKIFQPSIRS
ncbi:DNA polymerase III subunit delta [Porphyromonas crevioricanis]|uniref:DNA polymerase III delta N-terminal domain-containing protein n=1 Tax=Porphyromonas crevioricanis TaxID=393921 RepID=A0AB34PFA1_9PORP|nr:DNA polymerase III subunit delta [Porphyromonas crevioricanis]KGN94337.1 hypothetical protein HQ38_05935 [Porphyromonas crevioricanis]